MRLGQLSRKLQVKTADLLHVIETKFEITLSNHPNSKVPEELVPELEEIFKRVIPIDEKEEETETIESSEELVELINTSEETESIEETIEPVIEDEVEIEVEVEVEVEVEQEQEAPSTTESLDTLEEKEVIIADEADLNIVDGIIKAPKIEAKGIKIVGKIDLPEKKIAIEEVIEPSEDEVIESKPDAEDGTQLEQETVHETTDESSISAPKQELPPLEKKEFSSPKPVRKKSRPRRTEKIILTPEEERRIKLKEAQKLKLEAQKAKKEKRRETYNEDVKSTTKSSSSQKKKKKIALEQKNAPQKEKPTSLWGRFIYWLND